MLRVYLAPLAALVVWTGLAMERLQALPEDFELTEFVDGLRDPATMAFSPDGRLFVGERIAGQIRIVTASGQLLATPFLQLPVPPVRHRSGGLRGFAFDPMFPAEPYVYVFYTKEFAGGIRHNRVSKFTVSAGNPDIADPASETILMELPFNNSALGSSGSHNGGAVVFGGDGMLYFTTGDGWNASAGYGAGDPVQSLSTYTGKIFRIEKDGTIPADNPFHGTATGNFRAIYALGFRNPYAATVHPVSGEVFVFDVGTAHGGSKDYVYRISTGANYQHDDDNSGIGTNASPWANAGTSIISGGVWYFADQFPTAFRERLFVTSWRRGLKTVRSLADPTVEDFGSSEMNVKARTYATGFDPSSVASAVFEVDASMSPVFTNSLPTTAEFGGVYRHGVEVSGNPSPVYSLDAGPEGMVIHPETGEIFWLASETGPVAVTVRASNGVLPDALQSDWITVGGVKAVDLPDATGLTQGGLRYSYEEVDGGVTAGITPLPNRDVRQRDNDFRLRFTGHLKVVTAGDYEFTGLTGGDESHRIWIGDVEVTDQDIGLEDGLHRFVVEYEEIAAPGALEVRWNGPGIADEVIPASSFYYRTSAYGIDSRRPLPPYLATFPTSESGSLPLLLSETGAFSDLVSLTPVDGMVPYTPNSKLWSDGADKVRWIALPEGTAIGFSETGSWTYPPGTVLIKHFQIGEEKRRIETRFEVVKEGGSSYLVTYRWRADGTEADLVGNDGADGLIEFGGESQQWFFPSRANCVSCHNSSVGHVLGLSTRQLNGDLAYRSGISDNQLRTWMGLGMFESPPTEAAIGDLDALCGVDDVSEPLDLRVRSYFDSNCAYCHNSNAAPEGTNFVLEYDTPLPELGVILGATGNSLGLGPSARVIMPRDPRHSVLYHRLAGNDPAERMPPIGRTIVDAAAREMLAEWILSLPPANTVVDVTDYSRRWTFDNVIDDGAWRDTGDGPDFGAGQLGQALQFDGVDDAVDLGPLDAAGGSGLTIALWFKADDFGTSDARFLSKADGDQDQDHYWMVSALNSTKLRLRLKAGGTTTTLISDSGVLETGVWTHIAARYDGSTMKLYKDGEEVASTAKTGVLDTSGTVDAAIGNQPLTAVGGSRPFDGWIDEERIYPRALTETEIVMVRDAGGTPNSAPVVSILPPAEAVGDGNFMTRADAANLGATATDNEDGSLSAGIAWLSTTAGDVTPESLPDGEHTLIATARDANGSADSELLRVVVVPGFEGWASDRGLPPTPSMDDDGDGISLLEYYAFGLDPNPGFTPSPVNFTHLSEVGKLSLMFPANPLAIDLRYEAQFGEGLDDLSTFATWLPVGDDLTGGPPGSVSTVDGVFGVKADSAADGAPKKFGRISVEQR